MASMEHRKAFYRTEGKHYRQEAEAALSMMNIRISGR